MDYGTQCIITAIERMINRLEAENYTKSTITTGRRIDKRLMDMDCLKEALYNAVAHNDYSTGIEPSVYMFDDRIHVISHGGLPFGQTEENFFKGISRPRNPSLMRIMRDLGYVERTGHGVPNIVRVYGKEAFEITDSYINVIIPFDKEVMNEHSRVADKVADKLTDTQINILNLMINDNEVTIKSISEKLGMVDSGIRKNINVLKQYGLIERVGSNKKGIWIVK